MTMLLKRLTMVVPREIEESLVAVLLDIEPALPGFTTMAVDGHGEGFAQASVRESVRGRVDRRMLWMVLPQGDEQRVLAQLSARLPHSQIVWWIEPVEAMGRLA
ncbi:MAG: DUF3240 domain-containing protein [Rhodanobacter sp.]|nr:MAG: DUF3240 domain-containing protein [Rhodanobacter sp.]